MRTDRPIEQILNGVHFRFIAEIVFIESAPLILPQEVVSVKTYKGIVSTISYTKVNNNFRRNTQGIGWKFFTDRTKNNKRN
jgi:hypothetical protein